MTKNFQTKKGIKTRREKEKYPNLSKRFMVKSRIDYMDTEYINGIYDDKGTQLMRPLNSEEKEWLNKFYKEYYCANFTHSKQFHKNKKIHKRLYGANNARNRCIFNRKKAIKMIKCLDEEDYDPSHNYLLGFRDNIEGYIDDCIDNSLFEQMKWNIESNDKIINQIDEEIKENRLKQINTKSTKSKNNS